MQLDPSKIPLYPDGLELSPLLRPLLHPMFQQLPDGISEFTFANLYLFRATHNYRVSRLPGNLIIFTGSDRGKPFFMAPFGLPAKDQVDRLLSELRVLKCATLAQAEELAQSGYTVIEDRDNFDYLYRREDLAQLTGRKFSKKRNQIKAFINNYDYAGEPLIEEHIPAALALLDRWREGREDAGDYEACREALLKAEELQLCGGIYYADGEPVGFSLGEELILATSFVIHFEKAVEGYKGVYQFINQAFASILPDQYTTVNREQDLGNEGLRHAKMSYRPVGFVRKFRVSLPGLP